MNKPVSEPDHHRSIGAMLQHWAADRPDAVGIAVEGVQSRTFAQWLARSSALAAGLRAQSGVRAVDRPATQPVIGFVGKNAVT